MALARVPYESSLCKAAALLILLKSLPPRCHHIYTSLPEASPRCKSCPSQFAAGVIGPNRSSRCTVHKLDSAGSKYSAQCTSNISALADNEGASDQIAL